MPANYVLLGNITLSASTSSVTFSNIPQSGYTDLKVVMSVRSDNASNGPGINLSFNGNTANFSSRILYGNGTSASSYTATQEVATANGGSTTASTFNNGELYIPNYLSNNNKSWSTDVVVENNATLGYPLLYAGLWSNIAAINSVTLTSGAGNFVANSTFYLYGIAAVGTTPVIAPKATGGDLVYNDGTNWIHIFNSTGVFTPQTGLSCDYLVVAGGGGGAGSGGGAGPGGGAGGLRTATGFSVTAQAYTITVGAGGTATGLYGTTNGSPSTFSSITSTGGGSGGEIGGSGGGGYPNSAGAIASPSGQGNAGGSGSGAGGNRYTGGGGGGAGAVGGNASSTAGGNGGNGTASSYSGTSVTYAGGGGGGGGRDGGRPESLTGGTGGTGGGGNGGSTSSPEGFTNGVVNTGGGGGGAGYDGNPKRGALGGSGIVIIRYPIA